MTNVCRKDSDKKPDAGVVQCDSFEVRDHSTRYAEWKEENAQNLHELPQSTSLIDEGLPY